jgi:hypothetical protein
MSCPNTVFRGHCQAGVAGVGRPTVSAQRPLSANQRLFSFSPERTVSALHFPARLVSCYCGFIDVVPPLRLLTIHTFVHPSFFPSVGLFPVIDPSISHQHVTVDVFTQGTARTGNCNFNHSPPPPLKSRHSSIYFRIVENVFRCFDT